MNSQLLFATLASVVSTLGTIPYVVDIFRLKTTPHIYSWFVWMVLQGTGFFLMISEGAGHGAVLIGVNALLCAITFTLSFKYGTKNITVFDTICFVGALLAMILWFFLHDALLSIIVVSAIDLLAYFPTFRKAYTEPQTETVSAYLAGSLACLLSLGALSSFSITTSLYLIVILVCNFALSSMILFRRRQVC